MYNARYLQPQVNTVGLIAHYKLWDGPTTTGKVFDYSLRGHGGTLQGTSPTFKYPGIDLPGTNEYIEVADEGVELVIDGDFAAGAPNPAWVKGTGWTIAGGVANCDGTQLTFSPMTQDCGFVAGRKYRDVFTLSNVSAGTFNLYVGAGAPGEPRTADGTYTEYLLRGVSSLIFLGASLDFVGDVDNVSAKIVAANFSDFTPAGTPYSISIWLNPDDVTSLPLVSKGVYNTNGEWLLSFDSSDKLFVRRYDESVADCYIGRKFNTALTAYENNFVHIVWTSDGTAASSGDKLFINGVQVDDTDDENNAGSFVEVENLGGIVKIGTDGTNFANSIVDDLMFFNRVLGATEAKNIYEVTRQRYGV